MLEAEDKIINNSHSLKGKLHPDQSSALPNGKWYPENTNISELRSRRFEVIEEVQHGSIESNQSSSMPNPTSYPHGDQYFHMRSMIMAASYPDEPKIAPYGPYEDTAFSAAYTKEEQDMIDRASAICGHPGKKLGSKKSEESPDIHRHSPVNHNSGRHPNK
jgi:hypothetical protein